MTVEVVSGSDSIQTSIGFPLEKFQHERSERIEKAKPINPEEARIAQDMFGLMFLDLMKYAYDPTIRRKGSGNWELKRIADLDPENEEEVYDINIRFEGQLPFKSEKIRVYIEGADNFLEVSKEGGMVRTLENPSETTSDLFDASYYARAIKRMYMPLPSLNIP